MPAWHAMVQAGHFLLQTAPADGAWNPWTWVKTFVNTPAPYSPFTEYLALLFVLWLLARRAHRNRPDFAKQAQHVLDTKFDSGELSKEAYQKFRQDTDAPTR